MLARSRNKQRKATESKLWELPTFPTTPVRYRLKDATLQRWQKDGTFAGGIITHAVKKALLLGLGGFSPSPFPTAGQTVAGNPFLFFGSILLPNRHPSPSYLANQPGHSP